MPNRRLISVVMPCFNSERSIAESVRSALNQSHRELELIIVDDCSWDRSTVVIKELMTRDSRIKLLVAARNGGPSRARNLGIQAASGDFIAFLDSDDTWNPNCLEKLFARLNDSSGAILAYCGWQNSGLEPRFCKPYIPPDYEGEKKYEHILSTCPFPIHAVLVRTEILRTERGFDESMHSCEDYDLWLRVSRYGRFVRVPEVLAHYHHQTLRERVSTRNATRVAIDQWRAQRRFLERHPEVSAQLGAARVRELVDGGLLRRGLEAYWRRELDIARPIFRALLRTGYLSKPSIWRYLIPSLLPESLHARLLAVIDGGGSSATHSGH